MTSRYHDGSFNIKTRHIARLFYAMNKNKQVKINFNYLSKIVSQQSMEPVLILDAFILIKKRQVFCKNPFHTFLLQLPLDLQFVRAAHTSKENEREKKTELNANKSSNLRSFPKKNIGRAILL